VFRTFLAAFVSFAFAGSVSAAPIITSFSGSYPSGPVSSGSNLFLDGNPFVTNSAPNNSLAGASVSDLVLTLGKLSDTGPLLTFETFSSTNSTASSTIVVTQGSNTATFALNNPISLVFLQPNNSSFSDSGTLSTTATLTSSTIPNLTSIGALWDFSAAFQGNFRVAAGNPGTFTFGEDGTSSGSFTLSLDTTASPVPEPTTWVTFGVMAAFGAFVVRRRPNLAPVAA
jgi:hypothetical protein